MKKRAGHPVVLSACKLSHITRSFAKCQNISLTAVVEGVAPLIAAADWQNVPTQDCPVLPPHQLSAMYPNSLVQHAFLY